MMKNQHTQHLTLFNDNNESCSCNQRKEGCVAGASYFFL